MQVSVLASGSRGNCTLIHSENTAILIDMGISARKLKQALSTLHLDIADLNAVFITHEHIDHVRGLKTFTKNYDIPIYSRANTLKQLTSVNQTRFQAINQQNIQIGNLAICDFSISHDAVDPIGFNVFKQSSTGKMLKKFTLATDLGFVSEPVKTALEGSDIIVLEANHDVNLLQNGQYPWSLKKRILGTRGHLSNLEAAFTIKNLSRKPQEVILAHLSEQNNTPKMALNTISQVFTEHNLSDIKLQVATPDEIVSSKN